MITPTVGRVVWYYPDGASQSSVGAQPCAATVAYVHGDGRFINIGYLDCNGNSKAATSVRLIQEGDEQPDDPYCCWMP